MLDAGRWKPVENAIEGGCDIWVLRKARRLSPEPRKWTIEKPRPGIVRHFDPRYGVEQFIAIPAVDRLYTKAHAAVCAAGDLGAITAL
jgi:hypothetical protein